MKKILILGSSGFLGSHLKNRLINLKFNVYSPSSREVNLLNYNELYANYGIYEKFDYVINCAVIHTTDPYVNLVHESILNYNIIRFCKETQPQAKLICFGSDICYEKPHQNEFTYLDNRSEFLSGKYNEYIIVKKNLLRSLYLSKLNFNYYVLTSMYGPGFKLGDFHLVHKLIQDTFDNKEIYLETTGNELRQILFVEDVAENVIKSLNSDLKLINLGTKNILSLKQLIENIQKITNKFTPVFYGALETFDSKQLQYNKALLEIIDYNDTDLKYSLAKTINYYENKITK